MLPILKITFVHMLFGYREFFFLSIRYVCTVLASNIDISTMISCSYGHEFQVVPIKSSEHSSRLGGQIKCFSFLQNHEPLPHVSSLFFSLQRVYFTLQYRKPTSVGLTYKNSSHLRTKFHTPEPAKFTFLSQ